MRSEGSEILLIIIGVLLLIALGNVSKESADTNVDRLVYFMPFLLIVYAIVARISIYQFFPRNNHISVSS